MTDKSHAIKIDVSARYPHGGTESAVVSVQGFGDETHFLTVFRAALVAAGFSSETANRLDFVEGESWKSANARYAAGLTD